jgi:hypothetical protein
VTIPGLGWPPTSCRPATIAVLRDAAASRAHHPMTGP